MLMASRISSRLHRCQPTDSAQLSHPHLHHVDRLHGAAVPLTHRKARGHCSVVTTSTDHAAKTVRPHKTSSSWWPRSSGVIFQWRDQSEAVHEPLCAVPVDLGRHGIVELEKSPWPTTRIGSTGHCPKA